MIAPHNLRNLIVASKGFLRSSASRGLTDVQMSDLWASVHAGQVALDDMSGGALDPITSGIPRPDRITKTP